MQLRLGPAPQRLLGELRGTAPRRHDHPKNGARFADGIGGVDPPADAVGDVRGLAGEQLREGAVVPRDGVPHGGAARDLDRLFIDKDAQRLRHHRLPAA